jgi:hypothetical protein
MRHRRLRGNTRLPAHTGCCTGRKMAAQMVASNFSKADK